MKQTNNLYAKTPVGRIEIPNWEINKLINLTDEELLQKAIQENKDFCISPFTYTMIEKRNLEITLQQMINSNLGTNHYTLQMISNW